MLQQYLLDYRQKVYLITKKKSAKLDAHLVPIEIHTTCLHKFGPNFINILSKR